MKNLKYALLMAAAVVSLSACSPQRSSYDNDWQTSSDTRVCRDRSGIRVPAERCQQAARSGNSSGFMWFYMGRNSYIPPVGGKFSPDAVGSYKPSPGVHYSGAPVKAPATAVTRGGFGSTASAHSGSFGG